MAGSTDSLPKIGVQICNNYKDPIVLLLETG